MIEASKIAENYVAAWNAAGDEERATHLMNWAEDARYVDPVMRGEGRQGIATMIATARMQFPGHGFALLGLPDGHGDYVRFSWTLSRDGAAPVARGTDFVRLDDNGRIAEVVGFLDGNVA